jgi:hypothetical protein
MKKKVRNILQVLVIIAAGFVTLLIIYPPLRVELFLMRKLRNAPYIELHSYLTEQTITITDKNDIKALLESMDKNAPDREMGDSEYFAYICIPLPDKIKSLDGTEEDLFLPIYIGKDGTVQWGMPPDEDSFEYDPGLRDKVVELCRKYKLEIDY